MDKRYRKMAKKANGKIREIRDGQVVIEVPLPIRVKRGRFYLSSFSSF